MTDKVFICKICNKETVFEFDLSNPKISKWFKNITPLYCDDCVRNEQIRAEEENKFGLYHEIYRKSEIPMDFDEFMALKLKKVKHQELAVSALQSVKKLKFGSKMPYLFGSTGTGKTFLSLYFAKHCITEMSTLVKYINLPRLIHKMRGEKQILAPTEMLLILDDIGAHVLSNWTLESIYNIVDYRLSRKLPTIITSNISPFKFSAHMKAHMSGNASSTLCDALIDRILSLCTPVPVEGESIRLRDALKD